MGSEGFLNRMVEALGIIIYSRPKERPRKIESQTIEKIECVPIFYNRLHHPNLAPIIIANR